MIWPQDPTKTKPYFISLTYRRDSQKLNGESEFNMDLPEDWNYEWLRHKLADDFFCCDLAFKEVSEIKTNVNTSL